MWIVEKLKRILCLDHSKKRTTKPLAQSYKPKLEVLDIRIAPATWHVTSVLDAGWGTLRNILTGAQTLNGQQGGPTIADGDTVRLEVPITSSYAATIRPRQTHFKIHNIKELGYRLIDGL